MSDSANLVFGLQLLGGIITIVMTVIGAMVWTSDKKPKIGIPVMALGLVAWLWFPWLGYGVYRVACWSLNGINYCERPDTVIPADPKVIDLRHVEKQK